MAAKHSVNPWTKPPDVPPPVGAPAPNTSAPSSDETVETPEAAPVASGGRADETARSEASQRRPGLKRAGLAVQPEPSRPARLQIRTTARTEALILAEIRRRIEAGERGRGRADKTTVVEEALERAYGHLVQRKRAASAGL